MDPAITARQTQLFARCGWRQWALCFTRHGNPRFPRPPRTNGTARAAPLHVPALLAAVSAWDGRRMQLTQIRRKAGRCAPRSAPSRPARAAAAAAPHTYHTHDTPHPLARKTSQNYAFRRRKSPSSRPAASRPVYLRPSASSSRSTRLEIRRLRSSATFPATKAF